MTTDNHDQALEARAVEIFRRHYSIAHWNNPRINFCEDQWKVVMDGIREVVAALREARVPEGYVLIQEIDAKRLCGGDINSPGWELSSRRVRSLIAAAKDGRP